jgi:multidrug efflux pump subunit AcrA (membrane-fusion protein)
MNIFPSSAELWNTWFQAISIILILGTVLAGAGAIISGRIVSRNQARDLASANAVAARANEGVAEANLAIAQAKEETAFLTNDAETAKAERAEADKQIAIARADAARAKEGIANAEAQSAKATVEVTRLQGVVANAERERAVAQKALLELQERLKHRHVQPEQAKRFVAELKKLPKQTIEFGYIGGPADDSFDFTMELIALFKEAGWTVRNERSVNHFMDIQFVGIGLFMNGPQAEPGTRIPIETTPIMVVLQAAVKTLGMDLEFVNWPPQDKEFVRVVVGIKPVH